MKNDNYWRSRFVVIISLAIAIPVFAANANALPVRLNSHRQIKQEHCFVAVSGGQTQRLNYVLKRSRWQITADQATAIENFWTQYHAQSLKLSS